MKVVEIGKGREIHRGEREEKARIRGEGEIVDKELVGTQGICWVMKRK